MHHLNSQLLNNYPIARYATPQSIQRGRAYYRDGRVWEVTLISSQKAGCLVDGDTGEYTVKIEINEKSGELSFECDCYYAEEGNFCKHIVAAIMEVSEYLKEEEEFEEDETPAPKIKEVTHAGRCEGIVQVGRTVNLDISIPCRKKPPGYTLGIWRWICSPCLNQGPLSSHGWNISMQTLKDIPALTYKNTLPRSRERIFIYSLGFGNLKGRTKPITLLRSSAAPHPSVQPHPMYCNAPHRPAPCRPCLPGRAAR